VTGGFALSFNSSAQIQEQSVQIQPHSVVSQLAADYKLELASEWPPRGTFWYAAGGKLLVPLPYPLPLASADTRFFSLGDSESFIVDEGLALDSSVNLNRLRADLEWILGAIEKRKEAKIEAELKTMLGVSDEPESGSLQMAFSFSADDLWLELLSLTNAVGDFVIHPPELEAADGVYDLFLTTNLSLTVPGLNATNWQWVLRSDAGQTNLTVTNLTADISFSVSAKRMMGMLTG